MQVHLRCFSVYKQSDPFAVDASQHFTKLKPKRPFLFLGFSAIVYKPLNQNNSPWYQELGAKGKQRRQEQYPLTTRETVILNYIAHGYINKEIGYMLGISHQTVKNHVTNILLKLNVTDRTRAVVLAIQNGWILASDLE